MNPVSAPRARFALRRIAAGALAAALAVAASGEAAAQNGRIALVRDAETESLIRDYARPILKAAGLGAAQVEILLINDRTFNAFVADGRRMFMNIGVLLDAETPNEVIGVIAHETGHIAGNHLVRLHEALARAKTLTAIGTLLGVGTAVGGAVTGSPSAVQGGVATAVGTGAAALNTLLAYARTEEMSADRAGLQFLERTGQSGRGMLKTFRRFADQVLISARHTDRYFLTHPMPQERISQLEQIVAKSPFADRADPPALQARHDMMRAKLLAFTAQGPTIERRYPASDTSLPARYARAVLAFRFGNPGSAVAQIEDLLRAQPNNPWFWELKGQALLESGRPKEAVAPLRRAVALAPNEGLLRVMLGHALVASDDAKLTDEAIRELTGGVEREKTDPSGYRHLATAYARKGEVAMADLMVAQGLFVEGDVDQARRYAARAQSGLKTGSPAWLRADDIVSYKPQMP